MKKGIQTMRRRVLITAALAFCGLAASASAVPPPPFDVNACWKRMEVFCAANWQAFGHPDQESCVQTMGHEICNFGEPPLQVATRQDPADLQTGE